MQRRRQYNNNNFLIVQERLPLSLATAEILQEGEIRNPIGQRMAERLNAPPQQTFDQSRSRCHVSSRGC